MDMSGYPLILACASYCYPDRSLDSVLCWLSENGFSRIDLGEPHFHPSMSVPELKQLYSSCRDKGLIPYIVSVNASQWWDARQPGRLDSAAIEASLRAAKLAGADRIGLVANSLPEGRDRMWSYEQLCSGLREAASACVREEISINVEIHVRGPLIDLKQAKMLWEFVRCPLIGFTLDTSLLAFNGISFERACRELRDCDLNVHFRDLTDHDFFGIPGRGPVNFRASLAALKEIGYRKACVIELFRTVENYRVAMEDAVLESKGFLERLAAEV